MHLSIKSHLQARIAALFVGFFGGAIAFSFWGRGLHAGGLTPFVMPLFVFGGAFLLPLLVSRMVNADCPKCGSGSAVPASAKSVVYVCAACGAETNGLGPLMGVDAAAMAAAANAEAATLATPAGQAAEKKNAARLGILFLVIGLVAIAIAVWLAHDSIRLEREGLSTDARVLRVTHERGSKDNEMRHTAFVEYKVGGQARTLQRSWSSGSGSFWTWPNYHQGERLRVVYLPGDPDTASIDSWAELFVAPIFLTLFGVVFGVVGVAMMTYRRKPEAAPDGTMVLGVQPQEAPPTRLADSASWNFLRFAIGAAIFLAGGGAFYYFAVVQPKIERERIEREAATALEAAAQARAEAAKAAAGRAAAASAAAAKPVEARADMSECQLQLLRQRNEYAAKYPEYSGGFFNIRPPKGGECRECLTELTGKLKAWAGFDVVPRSYMTSDYPPGCVAYRQDIFGTAEGAKCVAAFLGSGYRPDQSCQADGFPYTIIHPIR